MGFPLNSNDPYIKSTGERTTLGAAVSSGGGGEPYTLPTASAETKGGVKIGSGLTMTGEVLSNNNPTPYSLPTAAADTLGGIKVGSGLSIADGVLSATGGSGGGGHLYKVTTSNTQLNILYVFTPSEVTIGTAGELLNAISTGIAIVAKGTLTGANANKIPRYAFKSGSVTNRIYLLTSNITVSDGAVTVTSDDTVYVETAYISSVSSTKIY